VKFQICYFKYLNLILKLMNKKIAEAAKNPRSAFDVLKYRTDVQIGRSIKFIRKSRI